MTPRSGLAVPSAEQGSADGTRAVPLAVTVFLVLDAVTSLIAQAYSPSGLDPAGVLHALQLSVVVAAAVATVWRRHRWALALVLLVVALVITAGPSGEEVWLVVVVSVAAAVRASPRQLGLVCLGQLGYAVTLGLLMERRFPGGGREGGLAMLGIATVGLLAGLVARRLLHARDARRHRVQRLERENAEIRAVERGRLADELQAVMTHGLATIEDDLDAVPAGSADLDSLRRALSQVDLHSRSLLDELRTLLEVLRQDPAAGPVAGSGVPGSGSRLPVHLTARHLRIGATAACGLLAARALMGSGGSLTDVHLVELALLACAVAVWRPVAGAACAVAGLVVSTALGSASLWDAPLTTLLCVLAAFRLGPHRFWVVILPVAAYGGLLMVTDSGDPAVHVALVCYLAGIGLVVGLSARHFARAREDSLRRLVDLTDERGRVQSDERGAVARELHDVVAHQLSVTTMLVMATSLSEDPEALATTLRKVRRSTEAARHELSTLLEAMRGRDGAGATQPTPLVRPLASARALAGQLSDSGHHPVLDIDPAADALDATSQRTLSRIMQEAATNILRYTPVGSTCHYTLAVDDTDVRLSVVSQLPGSERRSDLSLGWGLRGVRERVELTRGTFTAGPDRGRWVLAVTLPRG